MGWRLDGCGNWVTAVTRKKGAPIDAMPTERVIQAAYTGNGQ